ncbi:MAG TPA: FeoA family protein [Kiritimatiellia bacterium]|jgi:Fe2+ transport system protein FeoA
MTTESASSGTVANPAEFPLDRLDQHACATVTRVDAGSDDMGRLQAMGVCLGRTLELIQRGDPLIVRVLGSRIGVSARLASRVYVQYCAHHCDTPPAAS